jgi:hypothetical protein
MLTSYLTFLIFYGLWLRFIWYLKVKCGQTRLWQRSIVSVEHDRNKFTDIQHLKHSFKTKVI